jgi:3-hydroxyisobutyrate dehydrogenase
VLDAGPMASAVSRAKLDKLVRGDFAPQAAIRDVSTIADLVLHQAEGDRQDTPLIRQCAALYRAALSAGHGDADMAAVVHAFQPPRA